MTIGDIATPKMSLCQTGERRFVVAVYWLLLIIKASIDAVGRRIADRFAAAVRREPNGCAAVAARYHATSGTKAHPFSCSPIAA